MNTNNLYIYLTIFLFFSCTPSSKDNEVIEKNIYIDNFENTEIEIYDLFSEVILIPLINDLENIIGNIYDISIITDTLYLYDNINSCIFSYDINSGFMLDVIKGKGSGPNEYFNIISMNNDLNNIYLLDLPMNNILTLSPKNKITNTIKIPNAASDFICIDNGFLLYNLNTLKKENKIIHINYNGEKINSYLMFEQDIENPQRGKSFRKNNKNETFFFELYSNNIYKYVNNNIILEYNIDYINYNIPNSRDRYKIDLLEETYAVTADFFCLSETHIFSFIKNKKRYYSFYDISNKTIISGKVVDNNNKIPFFPQWQHKDYLIGICDYGYLKENNENIDLCISPKYDLKLLDDESYILIIFKL